MDTHVGIQLSLRSAAKWIQLVTPNTELAAPVSSNMWQMWRLQDSDTQFEMGLVTKSGRGLSVQLHNASHGELQHIAATVVK